jgi:hypothetical protein
MTPGAQHRDQGRGNRRHPTASHQRSLGILERRKLAMEHEVIGRVVEPDVAQIVIALGAGRLESRGLEKSAW